uniref:Uncharacterized protein n=1 Tax=Tanacetum cinerariifolium TaxID=118510 RepID=A0A699QE42_TANCI|nr:hypothetical protein [Tanacetum cinerariifolium]
MKVFLLGMLLIVRLIKSIIYPAKKVEETLNLRYLEDKPNINGLGQEWYFDLDYLTDSLGYTHFKPNPPAGPKVNDIFASMENNLDYAKELARLQKQEHEAHSTAAKNLVIAAEDPAGCSVSTGGVHDGSVPVGSIPPSSVPAGSVPTRSVPTSNVPAGGVLAGSIDSAGFGDPAASESVPAVFNPDHATDSTLPPGHSLGSSKHST